MFADLLCVCGGGECRLDDKFSEGEGPNWDLILASSSGSLHRPILLVDTHGHPHCKERIRDKNKEMNYLQNTSLYVQMLELYYVSICSCHS